jgi:hypothetical protein
MHSSSTRYGLQLFVISMGDGGPGLHREGGMVITMMWKECGTAVQEKMANTLMSRWPRSSRELQRTIVRSLEQWTPWFPRQSTI